MVRPREPQKNHREAAKGAGWVACSCGEIIRAESNTKAKRAWVRHAETEQGAWRAYRRTYIGGPGGDRFGPRSKPQPGDEF